MAVAGAVALTWASGPPLLRSSKVVLARPPPRLLACLGMSQLRDKSRLEVDSKSGEHVVQNLVGMAFPSLSLGKYDDDIT